MTSSLPLDELYLRWLYKQVAEVKPHPRSETYWSLFRKLYTTEFFWLIPNDDNRVEDGRDLRYEFFNELKIEYVDRNWLELNCSFLEMLIGLSRRLAFETDGEAREWFWHLLKTLRLDGYNDARQLPHRRVEDVLNNVIWRTYRRDGRGGLFPLKNARQDQRNVEIWSQLNAYLLEHAYN